MNIYCPVCGKKLDFTLTDGKKKFCCPGCNKEETVSRPTRRKTVVEIYANDINSKQNISD